MIGAETIEDEVSFDAWLRARPKETQNAVCAVLASRCALRVLPLCRMTENFNVIAFRLATQEVFLKNIIARTFRGMSDPEFLSAYNYALHYPSNTSAFDIPQVMQALNHTHLASRGATIQAFHSFQDAAFASNTAEVSAQDVAVFGANSEIIWENVRTDAAMIEAGKNTFSLYEISVWKIEPQWWIGALTEYNARLLGTKVDWSILLLWYETVHKGAPAFGLSRAAGDKLERAIALGGRDGKFHKEFWDREPSEINREIAEWVAEARAAEALQDAEAAGPGLSWYPTSLHYELVISGDSTDADVAGQAETAFEHSKLNARLSTLSKMATTISARRGWEQLQDICGELTSAIAVPTVELHTRILQIYDASLMLASLLDYNNKLVADRGGNEFRPLQADESLALQQVVMTVAPWIGRFPTAKRKDTEAGQMFSRMSDEAIFAHVKFVNQVQSAGLISEQDRKMLQSLLEALLTFGNTFSAPAEKAQAHGQGSVRKLTFAMALIVSNALSAASGAVGAKIVEDVVSETQTYKSTVKFLRDPLTELENIVKELPPHLRVAFESVLQQLKREVPEMPTPEPVADVAKRRPIPRRK